MLQIIKGLDGDYIIEKGILLKVTEVIVSDKFLTTTSGWIQYKLENGQIIKISKFLCQ